MYALVKILVCCMDFQFEMEVAMNKVFGSVMNAMGDKAGRMRQFVDMQFTISSCTRKGSGKQSVSAFGFMRGLQQITVSSTIPKAEGRIKASQKPH